MKTDTQIRQEGMQALMDQLGLVEAERFVALINRDSFDYTTWRQSQWAQESIESLADKARALRLKEH